MIASATHRDLLQHSFYQRWASGDLGVSELQDYAGQYQHVVAALPAWLHAAAANAGADAATLSAHALEEESHLQPWADFAGAIGVAREGLAAAAPNPATTALLVRAEELSNEGHGIGVALAVEEQAARVSASKLAGLASHYGIPVGSPGAAYFELHGERDLEHSAELRAFAAARGEAFERASSAAGDEVFGLLWGLLSSVERA
ncbi:MAG: iron-containing redox enzyme family protein [Candidatus Dormibacteria bacterium]